MTKRYIICYCVFFSILFFSCSCFPMFRVLAKRKKPTEQYHQHMKVVRENEQLKRTNQRLRNQNSQLNSANKKLQVRNCRLISIGAALTVSAGFIVLNAVHSSACLES